MRRFFVPAAVMPLAIKRELFYTLSSEVRRMVKERGLSEKAIVADFAKARKARRRR